MSMHKAQIFAIISTSLAVFGFIMSAVGSTFNTVCTQTLPGTITQVINGSVANVTSVACQGLITSDLAFFIGILGAIATFCALPFI